jgi:3',5'-cyclic AMP phosphodiesterase CpdA
MRTKHLFRLNALAVAAAAVTLSFGAAAQPVQLPARPNSLKFAVIGDMGTGAPPQYEVGAQMAAAYTRLPFEIVLMLGDNLYGSQSPKDYVDKFEKPYEALRKAGVTFFATLGNHDNPGPQIVYPPFNMNGRRYYTIVRKNVRFVFIDTNLLDRKQLAWLEDTLKAATEEWTVAIFHHPLYSNAGRHGGNPELRVALEPLFVKYGVDICLSGHDHAYERLKPQKGITYFLEGSSGQLRRGDIQPSNQTAVAFDEDQTFMVAEIDGREMTFNTITRTGRVIDAGVIRTQP